MYSKQDQISEIIKCAKDPVYFINNYIKIQHPVSGNIPFETYDFQDDCIDDFESHRLNIILKSRQLGLSTITAAYSVWYAIFKKHKNVLVIATKLVTAMNFIKKVKFMLDNVPKWLLLTKFEPTKQTITFSNGSTIKAIPTSPDAGRSESISLLIIDEAAFIRDFEDIWTGLNPTISTGGSAIIISTPNGAGGMYHKLWVDAIAETNEFNTIKLLWDVHPEHDENWFKKETNNLPLRKIAQEYLCDFISSGDTFLQPSELQYISSSIRPPIKKSGPGMGIWIWVHPDFSKKYVISSDVARGDAKDYSTFHIIDFETSEIVAEFMGKIPPDELADLLFEWGENYNNALIIVERNTFGYFTNVRLKDKKYKRLWYRSTTGDPFNYTPKDLNEIPGFETQGNTRPMVLGKLEELIRNKVVKSYSQRLHDQLQTFVWIGSKPQATKGTNDDLVLSSAIGCWLTNEQKGSVVDDKKMSIAMLKATTKDSRESSILDEVNNLGVMSKGASPYFHDGRNKFANSNRYSFDTNWLLK